MNVAIVKEVYKKE